MYTYTPSHQTVITPPLVGGRSGVSGPSQTQASMPLYTTKALGEAGTDTFTVGTQPAQTYTTTSMAPNGLLPGFYDPTSGKFYQEVAKPIVSQSNTLVATIQQPEYTQSVTAPVAFKTVPYTAPVSKTSTLKSVVAPVTQTTEEEVIISDEVQQAVALIKQLMERPAIKKMVMTYQQEGARGLFHWSTVRQGLSLFQDKNVKQSVAQLTELLKSPDVQAAIRNPKAVLGNDKELNALLDTFNSLGLIRADDEVAATPTRRKKSSVSAETVSDVDAEEGSPAEAAGSDHVPLEKLIAELSEGEEAGLHAGHAHAKQPAKRHTHRQPSAEAAED